MLFLGSNPDEVRRREGGRETAWKGMEGNVGRRGYRRTNDMRGGSGRQVRWGSGKMREEYRRARMEILYYYMTEVLS